MMNKICIIGVGLIGGSLAQAMIRTKHAKHVVGFGRDSQRLQTAQKSGVITDYTTDVKEATVLFDTLSLTKGTSPKFSIIIPSTPPFARLFTSF